MITVGLKELCVFSGEVLLDRFSRSSKLTLLAKNFAPLPVGNEFDNDWARGPLVRIMLRRHYVQAVGSFPVVVVVEKRNLCLN